MTHFPRFEVLCRSASQSYKSYYQDDDEVSEEIYVECVLSHFVSWFESLFELCGKYLSLLRRDFKVNLTDYAENLLSEWCSSEKHYDEYLRCLLEAVQQELQNDDSVELFSDCEDVIVETVQVRAKDFECVYDLLMQAFERYHETFENVRRFVRNQNDDDDNYNGTTRQNYHHHNHHHHRYNRGRSKSGTRWFKLFGDMMIRMCFNMTAYSQQTQTILSQEYDSTKLCLIFA